MNAAAARIFASEYLCDDADRRGVTRVSDGVYVMCDTSGEYQALVDDQDADGGFANRPATDAEIDLFFDS